MQNGIPKCSLLHNLEDDQKESHLEKAVLGVSTIFKEGSVNFCVGTYIHHGYGNHNFGFDYPDSHVHDGWMCYLCLVEVGLKRARQYKQDCYDEPDFVHGHNLGLWTLEQEGSTTSSTTNRYRSGID